MNCSACGTRLNAARWSEDGNRKACPHCSEAHGEQHVYYEFPSRFGETPARATSISPNGPQSYCINCRAKQQPSFHGAVLCGNIASVTKQPTSEPSD
jgi:hypothetical protein